MTTTEPAGNATVQRHEAGMINRVWDRLRSALMPGDDAWSPSVDIDDSDDGSVLEADLALIKRSKISIELSDSELTITGTVDMHKLMPRRTRRARRFEYRLALPGGAASEHIDASLNLIMRYPKPESAERGADPEKDPA